MICEELRESVLKWAELQKEPFLTVDVFKNIEEAETLKEASDSLRKLFLGGDLARKKIDNVRYVYIVSDIAPPDFEKCLPDPGKKSSAPAQTCDEKQQETGAEKAASNEQRKPAKKAVTSITQIMRKQIKNAGLGDLLPKEGATESATDASIEFSPDPKETNTQNIKPQEMPEEFTLTLQTPGGLKITITSGRVNA